MKKVVLALLFVASNVAAAGALVPGATNPEVTQENLKQTICGAHVVVGSRRMTWTQSIRPPAHYTNRLKLKQIEEFGLEGEPEDYEEDHLVPISVGGHPTSPDNLWPQSWDGEFNAHDKDKLELTLHKMVCAGAVPLAQAQQEIASDWEAAYVKYIGEKK